MKSVYGICDHEEFGVGRFSRAEYWNQKTYDNFGCCPARQLFGRIELISDYRSEDGWVYIQDLIDFLNDRCGERQTRMLNTDHPFARGMPWDIKCAPRDFTTFMTRVMAGSICASSATLRPS